MTKTKKRALIVFFLIILIGVGFFIFKEKNKTKIVYSTVKSERGAIIQTVSETGMVKSAKEISLNFLNSGRLEKVNYKVGDKVEIGDIIAELDIEGLLIRREEALASLDIAKETYNKVFAGATNEEINIAKANTDKAKTAYESALKEEEAVKKSVDESIKQAQKTYNDLTSDLPSDLTTYEQAVKTAETNLTNTKNLYRQAVNNHQSTASNAIKDALAKGENTLNTIDKTINDKDGKDYISKLDTSYLSRTKDLYQEGVSLLSTANNYFNQIEKDEDGEKTLKSLDYSLSALNKIFNGLSFCQGALIRSITHISFTDSDLEILKSGIIAEQSIISSAISSLQAAKHNLNDSVLNYNTNVLTAENALREAKTVYETAVKNAKNALATAQTTGQSQIIGAESAVGAYFEAWQVAQAEYNRVAAKANPYDISLNQARIRQAEANIKSIDKQIEDSLIKSPLVGVITKINYEPGELVNANTKVVSILGKNNFEIEALVSESDITKIKKGDLADITLDAFGEDIKFNGQVSFIEPAETVIQEVVYYKLILSFASQNLEVKSGMTANINIITEKKEDAIIIPGRAVLSSNSHGRYARILKNGLVEEKRVVVGIRGDGGMVEIIKGLSQGEEIILSISEK